MMPWGMEGRQVSNLCKVCKGMCNPLCRVKTRAVIGLCKVCKANARAYAGEFKNILTYIMHTLARAYRYVHPCTPCTRPQPRAFEGCTYPCTYPYTPCTREK